jgi:hypothetical protein
LNSEEILEGEKPNRKLCLNATFLKLSTLKENASVNKFGSLF